MGKKGQHSFRVIVQEKRTKVQGQFTDDLGWYNPHTNEVKIDQTKLKHWLANGAQPTDTVDRLIKQMKDTSEAQSYKGRQIAKKKKKEKKAEGAPAEAAAPVAEEPKAEVSEPEAQSAETAG